MLTPLVSAVTNPGAPLMEHRMMVQLSPESPQSNLLPLSYPVFSLLEGMPTLDVLLCPSHFKSYHETHFFPWQLSYLPKNLPPSSAVG